MKKTGFIVLSIIAWVNVGLCQYSPAAGEPGSTALHKDSSVFAGWANNCTVIRGYIQIDDTSKTDTYNGITSNRALFGNETMATGYPVGGMDCISLGDGGEAIVTFPFPIMNGEGFDFAVFENGTPAAFPPYQFFLELATVAVSSDGVRFVQFPAHSLIQDTLQTGTFDQTDPTKIHNLAGKFVVGYGTPFDLEELKDSSAIDVSCITHIKIKDVVGSISDDYCTFDKEGNKINDPWPTPFASGGFDLEAVGVIHQNLNGNIEPSVKQYKSIDVFPNPAKPGSLIYIPTMFLSPAENISHISITAPCGKRNCLPFVSFPKKIQMQIPKDHPLGIYVLSVYTNLRILSAKIIIH